GSGNAAIAARGIPGSRGSARTGSAASLISNGFSGVIIDIRTKSRGAVVAIALAASLSLPTANALAQPAAPPPAGQRPIRVGLGGIAGVVAFNVLALGVEALPGGYAYATGATVPAEMSVAMSRVYATTAAVIGGWIGYYTVAK